MGVNTSSLMATTFMLCWFYLYLRLQSVPLTSAITEIAIVAGAGFLLYCSYKLIGIVNHIIH